MSVSHKIDALERDLGRLKVDFDRYFNGALDLPPTELQNQLRLRLRDLRNEAQGSIENFRIGTLEARFNAYSEMFNRRVRDIEEGRASIRNRDIHQRVDVENGVLVSGRIDETAAAVFYQTLYGDSSASDKIDLDRFRGYLNQQTQKIRQRTGCSQVQFRLARENGAYKLKAKPLGLPGSDD